ncbi:MAG: efflux RND transporter periplasmic adaptor subunit [Alphaproteobacteria bacterium]
MSGIVWRGGGQRLGFAVGAVALAIVSMAVAGRATGAEFVVKRQNIIDFKTVFATVESVDTTRARARIGGTVTMLAIDEGSRVEAGQRLALVRDAKLPLERAALDARIKALNARRGFAVSDLERARKLRARGVATQARLDAAHTELEVIEGDLAAMRAQRAVVAARTKEGAVLAPRGGRVLKVHVTEGSVILPGETVATIAAETFVMRLRLPERHARFLAEGDRVRIGARTMGDWTSAGDGTGAVTREGRIRQVYPDIEGGRVTADVTVSGLGDYFVGERARVLVATGERPAIVVPRSYLIRRFGLTYARLRDGGAVIVQPGLPAAGGVEILSGLTPDDVIVTP